MLLPDSYKNVMLVCENLRQPVFLWHQQPQTSTSWPFLGLTQLSFLFQMVDSTNMKKWGVTVVVSETVDLRQYGTFAWLDKKSLGQVITFLQWMHLKFIQELPHFPQNYFDNLQELVVTRRESPKPRCAGCKDCQRHLSDIKKNGNYCISAKALTTICNRILLF